MNANMTTARTLSAKEFPRLLTEAGKSWMEDNALRLSAALAYYSIFSIAPLLVISIAIAGWVLKPDVAQGLLSEQLQSFIGPVAAEGVVAMVKSASKPSSSVVAGIVGTLTLLFGASGIFGQLQDALNTIWGVKLKSGQGIKELIRDRILSFGMVLVIGFLLLVSMGITAAISALSKYWGAGGILTLGSSVVAFGVTMLLFAAIFKVLPDVTVQWRDVWTGAAATALLFEIGKVGLSWYLGRESTASPYGAAASVVLVLLWVYYASLILLFGAEFTRVYAHARGSDIRPACCAEAVTAGVRAEEGLPGKEAVPCEWAPSPAKESLRETFPISARAGGDDGERLNAAQKHPISVVFAALGFGATLGLIWRRAEKPKGLSATEEIAHGLGTLVKDARGAVAKMWK